MTVRITNPAEPDRFWENSFLMDTGFTDSSVPRPQLEAIGLVPKGSRLYKLADGNDRVLDVTNADLEFMGEIVGGTITYGDAEAEPQMGITALASAGIEVDARSQRLMRRSAVRLKEKSVRR